MSEDQRYHPDDECPLFSERLEDLIVSITRGEAPNAGRFCGHCYTPLGPESARCPHCETLTSERAPVEAVPEEVIAMLRAQRKTESRIVNGFAYLGLTIAVVAGLLVVLAIPYFRNNLIAATILYAVILLVGGRSLAGVIGGYYGDRIAYDRARTRLRERWADWLIERDAP